MDLIPGLPDWLTSGLLMIAGAALLQLISTLAERKRPRVDVRSIVVRSSIEAFDLQGKKLGQFQDTQTFGDFCLRCGENKAFERLQKPSQN